MSSCSGQVAFVTCSEVCAGECAVQDAMSDPVIAADGHAYERYAAAEWLADHDISLMTGDVLPHEKLT